MALLDDLAVIEGYYNELRQLTDNKSKLAAMVAADAGAGDGRVLTVSFGGGTPFTYKITTDGDGSALQTFFEGIWNARIAAITSSLGQYLK